MNIRIASQICILALISWGGRYVCDELHIPLPGSIVAMIFLFILLRVGLVRLEWISAGATWLLSHMLLFIIPAAVGVMQYMGLMAKNGVILIFALAISSILVMFTSGASVEILTRISRKHHKEGDCNDIAVGSRLPCGDGPSIYRS